MFVTNSNVKICLKSWWNSESVSVSGSESTIAIPIPIPIRKRANSQHHNLPPEQSPGRHFDF